MRLELDGIRTPVNEFINGLGDIREPLDLVRGGKVIARVSVQNDAQLEKRRSVAAKKLKKLLDKAWAHADIHGLSEREAVRVANKAVTEARRKHAARAH